MTKIFLRSKRILFEPQSDFVIGISRNEKILSVSLVLW